MLVVDLAALKRNIARMSATAKRAGLALRPHVKTHKSAEIATLHIEAGAVGIACATIAEAEMLSATGMGGLLLTGPAMAETKFARIAKIHPERGSSLSSTTSCRSKRSCANCTRRSPLPVVVDMDVGQARTGVTDIADGVQLAEAIAAQPKLEFAGIQGCPRRRRDWGRAVIRAEPVRARHGRVSEPAR